MVAALDRILADLPPMDVAGRLAALRAGLPALGCDALLVSHLTNVRYLTGFTGSAGLLLVRDDETVLLSDGRYRTQSAQQLAAAGVDARIVIGTVPEQQAALRDAAAGLGLLGLEAESVPWAAQRRYAALLAGTELVATTHAVERLRRVKDDGELARLAAAAAVADEALARTLPALRAGPTEREFGLALDAEMRRLGADDVSFETIVASGPNAAKPHHRPVGRRIEPGELVVIDFGALVDGYHSDMTRTVCFGPPRSDVLARMVEVVAAAQRSGVAAVRAGIEARTVDAACRAEIARREPGWADAFVHGTGHGVGLDIHEAPAVSGLSADTLVARHVVTVEPGVYLPDHGGVRIEDTVVVTATGADPLTHAPKDLVIA